MINIFSKPAFLNINPSQSFIYKGTPPKNGQLMRVSSIIRGEQIAEQIGARLNPETWNPDDVNIYVKPMVRKGENFKFEGKPYLDIIDGHALGELARKYPEVTIITCSQADFEIMSEAIPNKIINIPQHHCNFERVKRTRDGIKTVGVIGTRGAFLYLPRGLEKALANRGIELLEFSRFFTRQDIVDFYLQIDIQIVWRPYKKILSNPLKLVNAASFGIPTIALDEPAFKELEGCYIPVKDLDELLYFLDHLKAEPDDYWLFSKKCLEKSEEYHIENIAKLYKELDK